MKREGTTWLRRIGTKGILSGLLLDLRSRVVGELKELEEKLLTG